MQSYSNIPLQISQRDQFGEAQNTASEVTGFCLPQTNFKHQHNGLYLSAVTSDEQVRFLARTTGGPVPSSFPGHSSCVRPICTGEQGLNGKTSTYPEMSTCG